VHIADATLVHICKKRFPHACNTLTTVASGISRKHYASNTSKDIRYSLGSQRTQGKLWLSYDLGPTIRVKICITDTMGICNRFIRVKRKYSRTGDRPARAGAKWGFMWPLGKEIIVEGQIGLRNHCVTNCIIQLKVCQSLLSPASQESDLNTKPNRDSLPAMRIVTNSWVHTRML